MNEQPSQNGNGSEPKAEPMFLVNGGPMSIFFPLPSGGYMMVSAKQIKQRFTAALVECQNDLRMLPVVRENAEYLREWLKDATEGSVILLEALRTNISRMRDDGVYHKIDVGKKGDEVQPDAPEQGTSIIARL